MSEGSTTEDVGTRLKRLRRERGLTQRELASPGVSYAYISRIEAGARMPSVKALRKLAPRLRVSVEYLETGSELRDVDDRELELADAELGLRLTDDAAAAERKLAGILDDARRAGDTVSAERARVALGLAAAERGDQLEAAERLEEVVADDEAPPPQIRPDLYTTLSEAYTALGAPERAVRLLEGCLDRVRNEAPDDAAVQTRYAALLSAALAAAGEHERSAEVVQQALERLDDVPDPYSQVRSDWSLARVEAAEGRAEHALEHSRGAMALLRAIDDAVAVASFLREHGRTDQAEPVLQRAYDLAVDRELRSTARR